MIKALSRLKNTHKRIHIHSDGDPILSDKVGDLVINWRKMSSADSKFLYHWNWNNVELIIYMYGNQPIQILCNSRLLNMSHLLNTGYCTIPGTTYAALSNRSSSGPADYVLPIKFRFFRDEIQNIPTTYHIEYNPTESCSTTYNAGSYPYKYCTECFSILLQ